MSPTGETFIMINMHWITQDWSGKTHTLGTMSFPKDHTTANISNKLMDLRLEFGVYPKNNHSRNPQCLNVVRLDKLLYFKLEPLLDKIVLTNDCGSDVSTGAEKDELWD